MATDRRHGFRVRSWLVLVAVVALAMGRENLRRRRAYCLGRASDHRGMLTWVPEQFSMRVIETEEEADQIARLHRHLAWHLGRAREFERVADRPWMPIPVETRQETDYPCLCGFVR